MKTAFFIVCLVGLYTQVSGDCNGQTSIIRNGKEYRLFMERFSLEGATDKCREWGETWQSPEKSDLISDIDADLQTCLSEMIETSKRNESAEIVPGVFLGGIKLKDEWKWKKGGKIYLKNETGERGFQKWAENQPMHIGPGSARCLTAAMQIDVGTSIGDWEDKDCSDQMYYICQRNIKEDLIWGYSNNTHAVPPERWGEINGFGECANKAVPQSPQDVEVSLKTPSCEDNDVDTVLEWEAKDGVDVHWEVKNTGRMIKIKVHPEGSLLTRFSNSEKTHVVDYMHLKWGEDAITGSEHTIGGIRYAGELQIFHAPNSNGERHAIAFMIQERPFLFNTRWNPLLKAVIKSIEANSSSFIPSPTDHIMGLLEDSTRRGLVADGQYNTGRGIRYMGSLPHPPCTQNVIWTVYIRPVQISKSQFFILRHIHMEGKEQKHFRLLTQTTRPIQPSFGKHCKVSRF